MSTSREVEIVVGKPSANDINALPKAERKARLAKILDRNLSTDKFHVALPSNMYGEWIPNDPISISEAERLGFRVDDTYANASTPFKSNKYIDVVHMIMPKETKELIDEVKAEEVNRVHNPKRAAGKIEDQIEDRHSGADAAMVGLPIMSESTTRQISGSEIESAIKKT